MFVNLFEINYYGMLFIEIVFVYFLVGFLLLGYARQEMFNPIPFTASDLKTQALILRTGEKIVYQLIGNPDASYVILYSHGNRTNISYLQEFFQELTHKGFAVLAYDYPGYGLSQGKATESNTYASIDAMYDLLQKEYHFKSSQIIAMGRSLGSGPTLYLASTKPVACVILDSAFMSIFRIKLPLQIFPFDIYNNLKRIKSLKVPLLIIHGKQDALIPFKHGLSLFKACTTPKESVWVEQGTHNNLTDTLGQEYYNIIQNFIKDKVVSY